MNQFVESLKRLYASQMISKSKVIELFEGGKITESEKTYILD
jgi:hypothetical protein